MVVTEGSRQLGEDRGWGFPHFFLISKIDFEGENVEYLEARFFQSGAGAGGNWKGWVDALLRDEGCLDLKALPYSFVGRPCEHPLLSSPPSLSLIWFLLLRQKCILNGIILLRALSFLIPLNWCRRLRSCSRICKVGMSFSPSS